MDSYPPPLFRIIVMLPPEKTFGSVSCRRVVGMSYKRDGGLMIASIDGDLFHLYIYISSSLHDNKY